MNENEHDLRAVDRRAQNPNGASNPAVYVAAVIVLCVIGISAIVALQLVQPEKDHTSMITLILGFLVPVVTALLAGAVAQVQKSVNGRLTQLLAMTARTHAAEGELQARQKLVAEYSQLQPPAPPIVPVVVPVPTPASPAPTSTGEYSHSRADDPKPPTARATILRSDEP